MPSIQRNVIWCQGKNIFCAELKKKDWQVLDEKSNCFTTFLDPESYYRWLSVPFGIKPVAEQYQCHQWDVLAGLTEISVIADDILGYVCGDTI